MSDEEPQCIAMDEQTDHKIVHAFRLCTAHGTMYETLDAGAESDGLAFNLLRMLFPDDMLLRAHMPLVGTQPSVSNHRDTIGRKHVLECEQDRLRASSKDRGSHDVAVGIDRLPQPPRLRLLPHVTPHCMAC